MRTENGALARRAHGGERIALRLRHGLAPPAFTNR